LLAKFASYNNKKLNFRTKQCNFLGNSSVHKGYKCFDHTTGRIYISRDVAFDEQVFPFAKQLSYTTEHLQNSHHPIILPVLAKHTHYTENSLIQGPSEPVTDNANIGDLQIDSDATNVPCDSYSPAGTNPNTST
jgi:hypothetical protein